MKSNQMFNLKKTKSVPISVASSTSLFLNSGCSKAKALYWKHSVQLPSLSSNSPIESSFFFIFYFLFISHRILSLRFSLGWADSLNFSCVFALFFSGHTRWCSGHMICAQDSLSLGSGDHNRCQGSNPRLAKHATLPHSTITPSP